MWKEENGMKSQTQGNNDARRKDLRMWLISIVHVLPSLPLPLNHPKQTKATFILPSLASWHPYLQAQGDTGIKTCP